MSKEKKASNDLLSEYQFTNWTYYLIIIFYILIIYSNSFTCNFHFDDEISILRNENIYTLDKFSSLEGWTNISQRPLTYFTLALNFKLDRFDPVGYHVFNSIIHIISSILVFLLAKALIRMRYKKWGDRKINIIAVFIALFFTSHPIERMDVT